jgi:hypothetical protein
MKLGRYAKAVVAFCTVGAVVAADGLLDVNDGIQLVLAVLGALGVYAVPNAPKEDEAA